MSSSVRAPLEEAITEKSTLGAYLNALSCGHSFKIVPRHAERLADRRVSLRDHATYIAAALAA